MHRKKKKKKKTQGNPGTQCRHPGLARAVSSPSPWQAAAWIPGVRRRPWPVLLDSQGRSLT